MRLGRVPVEEAEGAVLAHTRRLPSGVLAKGRVLSASDVEALREAGVDEVMAARLAPDDVPEDEAAATLARAAAGANLRLRPPFTGRANLLATRAGLAVVEAHRIRELNRVDESLTLATLPPWTPVAEGDLVATAKIIPLAVPGSLLERACELVGDERPVRIAPFRPHRVGLVLTTLPGSREVLLEKAEDVMRSRVEALGSTLVRVERRPHEVGEVAAAVAAMVQEGLTLVLVFGASAVVDRGDVVPRAVEEAGGTVERLGLPVDPGNLMLVARLEEVPVLGVPGCARSPKRSGFDQVLERLVAGLELGHEEVAELAVGGLLKEIPSRPQPRDGHGGPAAAEPETSPRVAALVLAAGHSSRMGRENKLLAEVDGEPMVARVVDALLEAPVDPVVVVTGHETDRVQDALTGRPVELVHNPDHAEGMSTSLRAGLEAVASESPVDAVLVCLADMPRVRVETVAALVEAFDPAAGRDICIPVHRRKRGNPVLLGARHFERIRGITGDVGAREILTDHADEVYEVPVDDPGVLLDVDTREALEELTDRESEQGGTGRREARR